eukprot:898639-Rhodomonas_salina.2
MLGWGGRGGPSTTADQRTPTGTSLRACYAMSGAVVPHDDTSLCARYAMPGTQMPYGAIDARATRCPVLRYRMMLSAYARAAILTSGIVLCGVSYRPAVSR